MLVCVRHIEINRKKVSVRKIFAILSVSNGFTLLKIFDDIHSGMKVYRLFFSELSYLIYLRKGIFPFRAFSLKNGELLASTSLSANMVAC